MARCQLGQRLGHAGQQFDLLLGDGAGKSPECARGFSSVMRRTG